MSGALSVRLDLFLAKSGFQLDIYSRSRRPATIVGKFADHWPETLVATAVMKAIQAALAEIDRMDDRQIELCGWTPEQLNEWRDKYSAFLSGEGQDPTIGSDIVVVRGDAPWPSF